MTKTIAVTLTSFAQYDPSPRELLEKAGMEISENLRGRTVTQREIVELARDAQGLIAGTEDLSAPVLEQLKSLRVISRCGVGLDNVDLKAAQRLGIKVFFTPDGPTNAVAEFVIGLAINLLRHISTMDRAVRNGQWSKKMGSLFSGKNVGIIGLGRIGRAVADLSLALNAKVHYYDPAINEKNFKRCELDELFKHSDLVTLHVPLSDTTKYLVNAERLSLMKKEAVLINCSRGGVVDETALFTALKEK